MPEFEAAYLELLRTGELERRVEEARTMLQECRLCGRECRVNRLESAKGAKTDRAAIVLNNLAKVCINQDKYSNAQNLCDRALDILENIFDEYHPYIADVLETQVQLHRKTGNMAEAARLEQRAEEIRVRKRVAYAPIARATN